MKLDENGEILVRGANVAAGYWQGNEMKSVLGEDGWFRTGDLGALDADGNLYFKGRKKNVIVNREGMNIYPDDLEAALRQQPEVRDCVVVGLERVVTPNPLLYFCCAMLQPMLQQLSRAPTATWRSFSRCDDGWCGPRRTFRARRHRSPRSASFSRRCSRSSRPAGVVAPAQGGLGRAHQPHHRTHDRRARGRRQTRRRPQPEFDGPRRADERARRPLPGGLERGQLRAGQHGRRAGAHAARAAARAAERLSLSPLGAALAGSLDSQLLLLPAFAAGDADHGASDDRRPRKSRRHRRAGADHLQSRDLHRRGFRADRHACANSQQTCRRNVGRAPLEHVAAAGDR